MLLVLLLEVLLDDLLLYDELLCDVLLVVDSGVVCRITDIEMNKPLKEMDKEL